MSTYKQKVWVKFRVFLKDYANVVIKKFRQGQISDKIVKYFIIRETRSHPRSEIRPDPDPETRPNPLFETRP